MSVYAQDNTPYQLPPQSIVDLVDAPLTPGISVDSRGEWMLLAASSDLPSIAELSQPELRIGGLRINPRTNSVSRMGYFVSLRLRKVKGGEEKNIAGLPANALIGFVRWSPDERSIAFTNTTETGMELWVMDVATASARKVTAAALNNAYPVAPYEWVSDSKTLICRTIPAERGNVPELSPVPAGPVIQENLGKKAPSRTYQDLLKNPYDEALFAYYTTVQLLRVGLEGSVQKLGTPEIIQEATPSPDGKLLLIKTLHRPFSYLVPASRFPVKVTVTDLNGQVVREIADLPLLENIPNGFNAVQTGPRAYGWRADMPATLYWAEAQDGGDPKKEAAIRDKVFTWEAPFTASPSELASTRLRFGGIVWGNAHTAMMVEDWYADRREITTLLNPSAPGKTSVLYDRSTEDTYTSPGTPLMKKNQYGRMVLSLQKNDQVYMLGMGASPEGNRPFVDLLNLKTKTTERLWRSDAGEKNPYYERIFTVLDPEKRLILTSRESNSINPNYYIRDLKKGTLTQITFFEHPYPQLKGVEKQMLRYKRADGVELTAELYLPAGYKKEAGALPTLLWAYPREFKSREKAGNISGSPYAFTRMSPGSPIFMVTQGYAVLDNTSIPIVGEGTAEPNDTFVEQLVAGAKAAIEEGSRLGVVDPNRVGVGGHSYGAFMTANLLSHSTLFKAGIARSGAYNRTLTPFGFQGEERTYWEAPDTYNKMSPFAYADRITTPLLLIHGEADNNAGTFPLQTERFYNALKGHGAVVRYVVLPHESHGYAARESVLHVLWEMQQWLDKYVKNAGKGE